MKSILVGGIDFAKVLGIFLGCGRERERKNTVVIAYLSARFASVDRVGYDQPEEEEGVSAFLRN